MLSGLVMICRVCNSLCIVVSRTGSYAPFFALRVKPASCDPYYLDGSTLLLFCCNCKATMPAYEFTEEQLRPMYVDYRQESYDRERMSVEPGYGCMSNIGEDKALRAARNNAASTFLLSSSLCESVETVLDFGGSDGSFVPPIFSNAAIDILDASEVPPVDDCMCKVSKLERVYDLVLLQHVLEHVGNPRDLVRRLSTFARYMYIEIPIESNGTPQRYALHEHVNRFVHQSIVHLVASLGPGKSLPALQLVAREYKWFDGGRFHSIPFGRYLIKCEASA